jgi:hypothetical protein
MDYETEAVFHCEEFSLTRKVRLSFSCSLADLAFLLYGSLVDQDHLSDYSFLLRFGEDIYITRMDEQGTLYGYSSQNYHILEEESFLNAIVRKADTGSFEIIDLGRQSNVVFTMTLGPIRETSEKRKPELSEGNGLFGKDLKVRKADEKEVESNLSASLPLLRKQYRFIR